MPFVNTSFSGIGGGGSGVNFGGALLAGINTVARSLGNPANRMPGGAPTSAGVPQFVGTDPSNGGGSGSNGGAAGACGPPFTRSCNGTRATAQPFSMPNPITGKAQGFGPGTFKFRPNKQRRSCRKR